MNFQQYDLFTDSQNLRRLYEFFSQKKAVPLRIEVERIGKTVVLIGCQKDDHFLVKPDQKMFGMDFPKVCTVKSHRDDVTTRLLSRFIFPCVYSHSLPSFVIPVSISSFKIETT